MSSPVKKEQLQEVDRSLYDFKDAVHPSYETDAGLTPKLWSRSAAKKGTPRGCATFA